MLSAGEWIQNQANLIKFVMVNSSAQEVSGLGASFVVEIQKGLAAFATGVGSKGEISDGWYYYEATAGESDTRGPVAVRITGAGCETQNLEYVVGGRNVNAVEFTYPVTNSQNGNPIEGAEVWISTDTGMSNVVWAGFTDALGIARDENDNKPWLDPGTYYVWVRVSGYQTDAWPDTEVVS